jgi:hypothetical protein
MIDIKFGIKGRFMVEVIRSNGDVEELAPWQDNLVTDLGLAMFNGSSAALSQLHVGAGSTPPAPGDLILEGRITSVGVGYSQSINYTSPSHLKYSCVATFGVGQAAGNVTELGIGGGAGAAYLFSRALIKDEFGTPTTITTLADEQLRITYAMYWYFPETPTDSDVDINGTTHTFSVMPYYVASWGFGSFSYVNGNVITPSTKVDTANSYSKHHVPKGYPYNFVAATSNISGSTSGPGISNIVRYSDPGNFALEWDSAWGLTAGNYGSGIGGFTFSTFTSNYSGSTYKTFWQVKVEPAIMKDDTMTFVARCRISWDRI